MKRENIEEPYGLFSDPKVPKIIDDKVKTVSQPSLADEIPHFSHIVLVCVTVPLLFGKLCNFTLPTNDSVVQFLHS